MSNELTNPNSYIILKDFSLADAMSEEMTGMDVSFDRIKIPAGGSTVFEVPGEAPGETDAVKEFRGVILYHHPLFTYYREGYTGGNDAPDCGSYDGMFGVGDPGGNCAHCPLNQFGSGENGGKACKNTRRIYILREDELIPLLLTLPTGSMKEFSIYVKRLLAKGRKTGEVVTRFFLKRVTNAGGIAYSQAQFKVAFFEQRYAKERCVAERQILHADAFGELFRVCDVIDYIRQSAYQHIHRFREIRS